MPTPRNEDARTSTGVSSILGAVRNWIWAKGAFGSNVAAAYCLRPLSVMMRPAVTRDGDGEKSGEVGETEVLAVPRTTG